MLCAELFSLLLPLLFPLSPSNISANSPANEKRGTVEERRRHRRLSLSLSLSFHLLHQWNFVSDSFFFFFFFRRVGRGRREAKVRIGGERAQTDPLPNPTRSHHSWATSQKACYIIVKLCISLRNCTLEIWKLKGNLVLCCLPMMPKFSSSLSPWWSEWVRLRLRRRRRKDNG